MFGLEDRYHLFMGGYRGSHVKGRSNVRPLSVKNFDSDAELWIRFLPAFVYDSPELLGRVLSGNTRDIVYRIPKGVIVPEPRLIRECLDAIFEDACRTLRGIPFLDLEKVGVHGISIGGTLATRLANLFKAGKLRLVAPGASFPYCIRASLATKGIFRSAQKNGVLSRDFNQHLAVYSPINNLDNLPKNSSIEVVLGRCDEVIPYSEGLRLVESMRAKGLDPSLDVRQKYGHGLTVTKSL